MSFGNSDTGHYVRDSKGVRLPALLICGCKGIQVSSIVRRKVEAEYRTDGVYLPIRAKAGVVYVFVVRVELDALAEREKAPREKPCNTQLRILTLVSELGGSVGPGMVSANRQAPLGSDAIAIGPMESAICPIEVCPVSICEESAATKGNMEDDDGLQALDGGLHGRRKIVIADGEDHRHALYVVQIENCDLLELFEGPKVELKPRTYLRVI